MKPISEPPPDDLTNFADDPRLAQAVQEYLAELERGRRPSRSQVLARYPDLADALNACLDGLEMVQAAAAPPPADQPEERPGLLEPATPLGDYRIVREVGRGGMGIVYEAVQLSLGRRVALKVLPFAAALDSKQLQRFKNEAHAAAQLHHPNIVPVYAVGEERGVHFYAMQLIEGQSLAELLRQLRQLAGADMTPLGVTLATLRSRQERGYYRTVARLMIQAAEALEHAHQLGIIHRDVKPGNLLTDVRGNLWITDFGLAQLPLSNELTQSGDVIGTVQYMSPEQAGGRRLEQDHRSDIYSLGTTLYELLTLQPLFPPTTRQALLFQVIHEEPRPPRALVRSIPVELETIVLKALNKSPAERYASAADLAADLRRFLEEKPILARRPAWFDHLRKWGRRHPSVIISGMLLGLVSTLALLVANFCIADEKARTRAAYERELRRAEEAEKGYLQARQAVDLLIQVSEEELVDQPQFIGLRKRLLEIALGFYQDFLEQRGEDTAARVELTAEQSRVRRILEELSALQGAHLGMILANAGVQEELEPVAEQREKLTRMLKRWADQRQEAFRGFREQTAEQRRQQFVVMCRSQEKGMAELLTPPQRKRLRQIAVQALGPRALRDPEVARALQLTPEQRKAIREAEVDLMMPRPPNLPPGDPAAMWRAAQERMRLTMERLLALLTPEQTAGWRELTGEPFKGVPGLFMPLPPPPR